MENANPEIVVGYALTSKKTKSFLRPKLEVVARYTWPTSVMVLLMLFLLFRGPVTV